MTKPVTKRNVEVKRLSIVLLIILLLLGAILFMYTRKQNSPSPYASADEIPRISVEEAYKAVNEGQAVLVDTRPLSSYTSQHAAGAISLPYEDVVQNRVSLDPDKWYILYCT